MNSKRSLSARIDPADFPFKRQRGSAVVVGGTTVDESHRYEMDSDMATDGDNSDLGHYVYVVECSDGTYYTGYTTDVERRVAEHNAGKGAKYTRGRRPVELVHVEGFGNQSQAMQREYAIKQLRRADKDALVQGSERAA